MEDCQTRQHSWLCSEDVQTSSHSQIALTLIIMNGFERLVLRRLKSQLPPHRAPAICNYSIEDSMSTTLYLAHTHLDKKDTYLRMLTIDFSISL